MAKIKLIKILEHADKPVVCYSGYQVGELTQKVVGKRMFKNSNLPENVVNAVTGALIFGLGLFGIEYSYYFNTDNGVSFSTGVSASGIKTMFKSLVGDSLNGFLGNQETNALASGVNDVYDDVFAEDLNFPVLSENAIIAPVTENTAEADYTGDDYWQDAQDVSYEEVYEID